MQQENNFNANNDSDSQEQKTNNKIFLFAIPILAISIVLVSAFICFALINKMPYKVKLEQMITQDKQDVQKQNISDNNKILIDEKKSFNLNLIKPVFAEFVEVKEIIKPKLQKIKTNIKNIENFDSFQDKEKIIFSDKQKQALENYGFFITDNDIIKTQEWGVDDFVDMYNNFDGNSNKYYREPQDAIFITSDVALHLYHILIDRSFQKIEESKFQPFLRAMTKSLFLDSIDNYNIAVEPEIKESYKRLSAYYLIPLVVLDTGSKLANIDINLDDYMTLARYMDAVSEKKIENSKEKLEFSLDSDVYENIKIDKEIYDLARAELQFINNAERLNLSPIFTPLRPEFINDYSQFKPRSHYTKNDILKSYFIAMMWYGRMGFPLKSQELTRDALIITKQINSLKVGNENLSKLWLDMSAAIDFFVGETDDLTAYQYTEIIKKIYGEEVTDKELVDKKYLNNFTQIALDQLPPPKIISEVLDVYDNIDDRKEFLKDIMQFRFMGQRFTPDAYIINSLTQGVGAPDSETGQMLPSMPTALMPVSLLKPDNKTVKKYLDEWVIDFAPKSDKVIAKFYNKLNNEFSAYGNDIWTQNIYWSWLYCFKPLLSDYDTGYPFFMANENWQKKNLGTVLGSYTELKHDTLLYAKQSYAELGGGGGNPKEIPPVVKGYVEPDLIFWNRITALAKTTENGLKSRNIFPKEFEYKFKSFIESAEFFRQIAKQELLNEKISDEDFEKLRTINLKFNEIVEPLNGQELATKEKRAGIIADIHTNAVKKKILYEATGKPYILYVVVNDINGARLTRGAVFNHYEFTAPLDNRLADEDWQKKVYEKEGIIPDEDKWSNEIKR
ncbi:MAG: DUF3160 domain-containing protein [Patescibacteria group bacterium]|nr:DUF3160 domain-containing protein [Patescibacteria group bacterium]